MHLRDGPVLLPRVMDFAGGAWFAVIRLNTLGPSLEDVYLATLANRSARDNAP